MLLRISKQNNYFKQQVFYNQMNYKCSSKTSVSDQRAMMFYEERMSLDILYIGDVNEA